MSGQSALLRDPYALLFRSCSNRATSVHPNWEDGSVAQDRLLDRLDPAAYDNDDGTVGVFEFGPADHDALQLSGRLFHRLTQVAAAYELHTLPMLGGSQPEALNRLRCQSFLDELAFISDRLNDPLAIGTAQQIADYVAIRVRRPSWEGSVTFEGD